MPPAALIPLAIGTAAGAGAVALSGAGKAKKAHKQAQEFAEQQAAEGRAEQQRLEEKYGLTPGELERQDRTFALEKERQTSLQARAGKTGEDLLRGEGPTTERIVNRVQERLGKSGQDLFLQEGGQPAQDYYNRVTAPTDQGTLGNELELVRQMVNQEANRRGVFGGLPEGGIRFEQLGRAGVELAIKSAREKMAQQQSLASGFINLAQNARAEAGNVGESSISVSQRARQELDAFLANQQGLTQQSQGRATQVGLGAANIADNANARSYGTITDIYGQQAGQGYAMQNMGLNAIGDLAGFGLTKGFKASPATTIPLPGNSQTNLPSPGKYQRLRIRGGDDDFLAGGF